MTIIFLSTPPLSKSNPVNVEQASNRLFQYFTVQHAGDEPGGQRKNDKRDMGGISVMIGGAIELKIGQHKINDPCQIHQPTAK